MSLWNDVKKTVKNGLDVATEKTEEYTKIAKIKVDILTKKKDLDKSFRELGEKAYNHMTSGKKTALMESSGVKGLIDRIKKLQKEIRDKATEIGEIKKKAESKSRTKSEPVKTATKPVTASPQKATSKAEKAPVKQPATRNKPVKKS